MPDGYPSVPTRAIAGSHGIARATARFRWIPQAIHRNPAGHRITPEPVRGNRYGRVSAA